MLYSISGKLEAKREHYIVVNAGGFSLKVLPTASVLGRLPEFGSEVKIFTHLHFQEREGTFMLFGFSTAAEIDLFERLIGISGVGPKSALSILNVSKTDQLVAAINEGRTELITRASGIGKKTAERIVLELKGKLTLVAQPQTLSLMESDLELEETLVALGYSKVQAKAVVGKLDPKVKGFKERLKEALKKPKP